jgi:hypothetical protein
VTPLPPSIIAAQRFHAGEPGSGVAVVKSTLGRAAMIGAALFLLGERERLLAYALGSAVTLELFVLLTTRPDQPSR